MSQTLKEKMVFSLISILSALLVITIFTAGPIVRARNGSHKNQIRLERPIVISSDSFSVVGKSRGDVIKILGKPEQQSKDGSTFIYYRRVTSLDRDQVVVVKFENGIVKTIDTNIN